MSDAHANWWMDASCRWHQGAPPPGWWQAQNGRWHPPSPDDPTDELELTNGPRVGGAHLAASGQGANLWQIYRSWPRWARLTAPIVAFLLVVGALGAAATGSLREDGRETTATEGATTTTRAETPATSPNAVTPAPSAGGSTTTSSVPRTTAPPQAAPTPTTVTADPAPGPPTTADPPTDDLHPGAPCSPEGATAVMGDGTSIVCTTQKCHGAPFSQPRWRRASC
jgi:hypothetical protein